MSVRPRTRERSRNSRRRVPTPTYRGELALGSRAFRAVRVDHHAEFLPQKLNLALAELPRASRRLQLGEQRTRETLELLQLRGRPNRGGVHRGEAFHVRGHRTRVGLRHDNARAPLSPLQIQTE